MGCKNVNWENTQCIKKKQLLWYGHTISIHERRLPKMIYYWMPTKRRNKGRSRKREGARRAMDRGKLHYEMW